MSKPKKKSNVAKKIGALALAAYVPGFFRVHWRYIRHSPRVWAALFVAPFLAIKLFLTALFTLLAADGEGAWKFGLIAIFIVALCFFFAERDRRFRMIYVYLVPVIILIGLLYWAGAQSGYSDIGYVVKAALIIYFSYRVGKFTISKGYQQLSDGADKNFRQARELYDLGEYDLALPVLEKAAERGHFKSLYLVGDAYEHGNFYQVDLVKAAEYFMRSGKKGYRKANARFTQVLEKLTPEQKADVETIMGIKLGQAEPRIDPIE